MVISIFLILQWLCKVDLYFMKFCQMRVWHYIMCWIDQLCLCLICMFSWLMDWSVVMPVNAAVIRGVQKLVLYETRAVSHISFIIHGFEGLVF